MSEQGTTWDDQPVILYDEDNNPIEGVLLPDKAKELQEKQAEMENNLKSMEEELNKLREKDLNFSSFRRKSKEEQEKIKAEMTAEQRMMMEEMDDLREQLKRRDEATIGKFREEKLASLAGGDKDLQAKIQEAYDRLGTDALSREEIDNAYEDAFVLVQRRMEARPQSPLGSYTPTSGDDPWARHKKKNFADTEQGQSLAKDLGLQIEPRKNQ